MQYTKEYQLRSKGGKPKEPDKQKKKIDNWNKLKARAAKKIITNNKEKWDKDEKFLRAIYESRPKFCEECGTPLPTYKKYQMHHILSKRSHPELRYEEANISELCLQCHSAIEHGKGLSNYQTKKLIETKLYFGIPQE